MSVTQLILLLAEIQRAIMSLSPLSILVDATGAHVKKTTKKPGMPFADSAIAKYIDKKIDELKGVKTQREIAAEIGYDKPNLISMFKRGEARVPLDKIPLLAKALGVDPAQMFRLALEQYWPDRGDIIEKLFGRLASENEEEIFLRVCPETFLDPAKPSDHESD